MARIREKRNIRTQVHTTLAVAHDIFVQLTTALVIYTESISVTMLASHAFSV